MKRLTAVELVALQEQIKNTTGVACATEEDFDRIDAAKRLRGEPPTPADKRRHWIYNDPL